METPMQYYHFGRDLVGSVEARRVISRANVRAWLIMPMFMQKSARRFGIHLSDRTMERLVRVIAYTWYADTLLDESPDKDMAYEVYHMLIESDALECQLDLVGWCDPLGQPHFLRDLISMNGLFVSSFDGLSRDQLNYLASAIGRCAIESVGMHSVTSYASLQAREARLFSGVHEQCLTEGERSQPKSSRFADFGKRLIAMINVFDAAGDLSEDYAKGLVSVRPTRANQAVLILIGLGLGVDLSIHHPLATCGLIRDVIAAVFRKRRMERASNTPV